MARSLTALHPAIARDAEEEELRHLRALGAMHGLEMLLETLPPGAEVAAADIHALVVVVHDTARDVLLWQAPPPAANDA